MLNADADAAYFATPKSFPSNLLWDRWAPDGTRLGWRECIRFSAQRYTPLGDDRIHEFQYPTKTIVNHSEEALEDMKKMMVSVALALVGLVVFVFGNPYYRTFWTNWNLGFYILLSGGFLIAAGILKSRVRLKRYWPAAYAFFIASSALLSLKLGWLGWARDPVDPVKDIAIDKLAQFLQVVPVILVLTWLAKENLGSIFIQRGNLRRGLTFGLISFAGFAALAYWMQAEQLAELTSLSTAIPWILLFIFANATMEELWFRGIFLRKFESLIGRLPAILVTSLAFGASHVNATYEFPGDGVVFGLVVFGLGVVGGYAMLNDDSVIGPVLFHAGYDLVIIVSVLQSV